MGGPRTAAGLALARTGTGPGANGENGTGSVASQGSSSRALENAAKAVGFASSSSSGGRWGARPGRGASAMASRRLAMALAPEPVSAPPRTAEPNLEGLSEIPQELIWNRPPDEEDDAKPTAFAAFSKAREELPWDATEPVPFSPLAPGPVPVRAKRQPSAVVGTTICLREGCQVA